MDILRENGETGSFAISGKEAKVMVEKGKALERLMNNQDFKKIITVGYLETAAIQLVLMKAQANMQNEVNQRDINKQIDSIGSLNEYFEEIRHQSSLAATSILNDEETRDDQGACRAGREGYPACEA
jgi:hypothetical protein